jgi:hypothetical protein
MTPEMEAAVLRESEDTLRELTTAYRNVGLNPVQIAMMLRSVAEELDPILVVSESRIIQ